MPQTKKNRTYVTPALVTVQVLFGINYISSKIILGTFPPLLWASFRILVAAFILLTIALLSGRPHPPLKKEFFVPLVFYAFLGNAFNQAAFLIGLRYTTATNSAILNTLIPVFTLLFVTLLGKEPLKLSRGLGFIFAFAGVLVIRGVENISLSNQTLIGDSLTILNCMSYGLFLTLSKKFIGTYDSLWTITWLFLVGSFGLTVIAIPDWITFQWPVLHFNLLCCMLFSVLGCTLLAYFLNLWALRQTHSSSVALFIYLQPVVASILAWFYLNEAITLRILISWSLIFIGMVLGVQKQ